MPAPTAGPTGAPVTAEPALIGPNALWQLLPVLDRVGGRDLRDCLLAEAGIFHLPDRDSGLIEETPVARLHQVMRRDLPDLAPRLAWEAGKRTGDYILVNRIPRGAHGMLRVLPGWLGAPLLARAIAKHSWTFAGSGQFRVIGMHPPVFDLADNPVVRGERSPLPLCHWHAAVFERLFSRLLRADWRCVETTCCAMGAPACRFEMHKHIAPVPAPGLVRPTHGTS